MTLPALRLSLRNKILISTVGLVFCLTIVALFVINVQVQSQIKQRAAAGFASVRAGFGNFLYLRGQQLVESSLLISKYPSFVDPVVRKDEKNVRLSIIDMMTSLRADLLVITDESGTVLGRFNSPITGDNISDLPSVANALSGRDADSVDAWVESGHIYTVATSYILMPGRSFITGTISLGQALIDYDAEELARSTSSDISFIYGNNVLAASKGEQFRNDLLKVYFNSKESIDAGVEQSNPYSLEAQLDAKPYLVTFGPIVSGRPGMYAIAIPLEQQIQALEEMQRMIFLVGAGGLIISVIVAVIVSGGITSPVQQLLKATEAVRTGNFDHQISVRSKDELGSLAESFNSMVSGLRERNFMEKFVSSSTMEMINQSKQGNLVLGGDRKVVTVFFSDIRGFTAYSERVSPEEVIELLNAYLSVQTRIIVECNGVIDKFVGDEIVAIFPGEDMVDRAVESAARIQREITTLRNRFAEKIDVGIGINTGMVVLGNVGSQERMDHTVLGSNVNLASRLCSRAQPGQILLSESSYRLLRLKMKTRMLDAIQVKGFTQPVQVFEVLYHEDTPDIEKHRVQSA